MISKLRNKIDVFINSKKDYPLITFLIVGLTPVLFYGSNNYWAVNSWSHLLFFVSILCAMVLIPFLIWIFICKKTNFIKNNGHKVLFWFVLLAVLFFLTHTYFLSTLKRIFLFGFVVALGFLLPFDARKHYKKIIVLLGIFSCLSVLRVAINTYEDLKGDAWLQQPDDIINLKLKATPNIYLIQPDGYVAESVLKHSPYDSISNLYQWLKDAKFKIYDEFRSNYPASLTSNASLFGMKHHRFGDMLFPAIEMANGREAITTSNPSISVLNNNGYTTFFIAQDEYFQQNRKQENYDYFNISKEDFPYITKGDSEVRNVFDDLKKAMSIKSENPKFFFVEKLLPHHVGFYKTEESIKKERDKYLQRISEVNLWLKEVVDYITEEDENSIIIILADHGGWVGLKSFNDLFSNESPALIHSIFSNIAAIKWNGHLKDGFDKDLKTNVNMFRVLFSVLSEDSKYLDYLEDDSSYNLKLNTLGLKNVVKAIDDNGNVVIVKESN
ncbi:sulfatase-like hydrolase/transferase [Winogradskyella sp. A2]|uniref:sulfatase-like hydrolase/transferase n=1 Tax=Winogradskyella sp. A2 TaxID=3366944 RepID=UPI00398C79D6